MVAMITKQWSEAYHGGHGNQQWGGAYMVTKLWGEAYHGGHHMVTKQWVGLIQ